MQNLKDKQEKEMIKIAEEIGFGTLEEAIDKLEKFLDKVRKETRENEKEKIKQNIGLLRQWLNERTDTNLITNKELETFLL